MQYETNVIAILRIDEATQMEIRTSAPGKVILHGEHSVVYGKTALAVSVDLRTQVVLKVNEDEANDFKVNLPDLGLAFHFDLDEIDALKKSDVDEKVASLDVDLVNVVRHFVQFKAVNVSSGTESGLVALIYLYLTQRQRPKRSSIEVSVTSNIPIGAGLGSSAAFSVALSAAFHKWAFGKSVNNNNNTNNSICKKAKLDEEEDVEVASTSSGGGCSASDEDDNGEWRRQTPMKKNDKVLLDVVCRRAFLAEKILHGNPSGKSIRLMSRLILNVILFKNVLKVSTTASARSAVFCLTVQRAG